VGIFVYPVVSGAELHCYYFAYVVSLVSSRLSKRDTSAFSNTILHCAILLIKHKSVFVEVQTKLHTSLKVETKTSLCIVKLKLHLQQKDKVLAPEQVRGKLCNWYTMKCRSPY